jgi:hypothetical protein
MLEATQRRCPQFDAIEVVVEVVKHLYRLGDNGFFLLLLHHDRDSIYWDVLLPYDKSFFGRWFPMVRQENLFIGAKSHLLRPVATAEDGNRDEKMLRRAWAALRAPPPSTGKSGLPACACVGTRRTAVGPTLVPHGRSGHHTHPCRATPAAISSLTIPAIQVYPGHRNIQNTTRCTALAPQRFEEFFRNFCSLVSFSRFAKGNRQKPGRPQVDTSGYGVRRSFKMGSLV